MAEPEGGRVFSVRYSPFALFINFLCILWVIMHLYAAWRLPFSIDELKVLHLGFASAILFFFAFNRKDLQRRWAPWLWLFMAVVASFVTIYFFLDSENMVERIGQPSLTDVVIGTTFVCAVFLIAIREWGYIVPLITFIAILYGLYGNYLGSIFFHSGIDFARMAGYLSTYFMGTLGSLTGISATVILHFLLFGALLEAVGGAKFFEKLSILICSRFASGAAQTSVWSSALFGMISGSVAANVAVDGPHTIPMMKRKGYSTNFAGAVEAVASTGGQIMPPVMGVAAFILASLIGITYAQVCIAAFLPAFVYYGALAFAIMVKSRKMGITKVRRDPDAPIVLFRELVRDHGHLLIPIVVLTWRLLIGESPAKSALYANLLMVILGLFHAMIFGRKDLLGAIRQFGRDVYKGLVDGGREGAKLGVILGTIGIIIEMFTVTGFGQRLSYGVIDMAGGNSFLLICMVAVLTLFFGMGMPTPGAYLLAVLLSAPALIKFGFPELSVHMFVFYFAIISALTPPVAVGVLVAVGISGGSYVGTAKEALRLALPGFLLPFYFLYQPEILMLAKDPLWALLYNFFILVGVFGLTISLEGFLLHRVGWIARIFCLAGALGIFHPSILLSWIGTGILLAYGIFHFVSHSRIEKEGEYDEKWRADLSKRLF